jgi:tight adherence protein C
MNDVRAGRPLLEAIAAMAARIDLPPVTRVIDALVVAVERGTPVAEVLRAQARDVRDGGKQALMESAGRREIAMMVPVVFLVLPVTVVFALFPGFFGLSVTV